MNLWISLSMVCDVVYMYVIIILNTSAFAYTENKNKNIMTFLCPIYLIIETNAFGQLIKLIKLTRII